jgi:hypothetical protein
VRLIEGWALIVSTIQPRAERKTPIKRKAATSRANGAAKCVERRCCIRVELKRDRRRPRRRKAKESEDEESEDEDDDDDEADEDGADDMDVDADAQGEDDDDEPPRAPPTSSPREERLSRGARTRANVSSTDFFGPWHESNTYPGQD